MDGFPSVARLRRMEQDSRIAPGSTGITVEAVASNATSLRRTVRATQKFPVQCTVSADSDTHPYASVAGSEVRRGMSPKYPKPPANRLYLSDTLVPPERTL